MTFNKELFLENLNNIGVSVSDDKTEALDKFAQMLIEKNKVMNLTRILDEDGIAVKHFADSLSILKVDIPDNSKVMDLGCGAGFPGVPLLIAKPDINLTLLDSTAKKLGFVAESIEALGLKAEVLHARAEEAGQDASYREQYDFVLSRAVASLNVLCEYCLPFVKVGGKFVAMKSALAEEEIKQAYTSIKTLGGKITEKIDFNLTDGERTLIIIEKVSSTPSKYPRQSGKIKAKPL